MAQAQEPQGNRDPAPGGDGARDTPGKAAEPGAAKPGEGGPAEVTQVLSPEVVSALRAATQRQDQPPAARAEPSDRAEPAVGAEPADETGPTGEAGRPGEAKPVVTVEKAPVPAEKAPVPGGAGPVRAGRFWETWSRRTWVTNGSIAAVVLIVIWACSGMIGGPAPSAITTTPDPVAPSASAVPPAVPQVATHPVRTTEDLDAVCANSYYPAAPKYRGKAPHPIVISARERPDLGGRSSRTLNRFAYSGSATAKKTWAPAAKLAQLVACLDLTGGGAKVKDCKADDATPAKLPLKVGRYRLTVYEVATGRKVVETTVNGADKACPWVVMTGSDPTLYTAVDDNQLYRALQAHVTQAVPASAQPKKRS